MQPDHMRAFTLAEIIARETLNRVRTDPADKCGMAEWHDGRASAAALMYPMTETVSAANEIRFLVGQYRTRHYGR
jgi:hypothetical protein